MIHLRYPRYASDVCFGDHFSTIIIVGAKTKYINPFLLEVFFPYLQNHTRTSLGHLGRTSSRRLCGTSSGRWQDTSLCVRYWTMQGRPQDVCRRRPQGVGRRHLLVLHIGTSGEVLKSLYWNVFRTSLQDHMGTSIGRLSRTSSGRNFAEWVSIRKNQIRPLLSMIWPMVGTKIYPEEQLLTKYFAIRNSQVQVIQSSNVIQSNNPKYDENTTTHLGTGNISEYQQLTNELHRSITRKF